MTTRARQQRNTTVTQFDSSDFFVRRPEEYEGTLIVLTTRIEESYGYLNQLLCILNELRCHFQEIAEEFERDMDWFEESSIQPIVTITRNGEVGTRTTVSTCPRTVENLQGTVVFQLPRVIVARSRCQVTVRMILRISRS